MAIHAGKESKDGFFATRQLAGLAAAQARLDDPFTYYANAFAAARQNGYSYADSPLVADVDYRWFASEVDEFAQVVGRQPRQPQLQHAVGDLFWWVAFLADQQQLNLAAIARQAESQTISPALNPLTALSEAIFTLAQSRGEPTQFAAKLTSILALVQALCARHQLDVVSCVWQSLAKWLGRLTFIEDYLRQQGQTPAATSWAKRLEIAELSKQQMEQPKAA